jgi:Ca-activated chloride channel family protein
VAGTLWARRRVDELLSARPSAPAPEAVEEIVEHALRFKLVTPYTSFVAVERELRVDPRLPLARAAIPNALPEGVSFEGIFGAAAEVRVLPARVKPGDPELRVVAAPTAVAVRVALPFEPAPRDAIRDETRGDWVLRFLVPSGWPDGSWDARVTIVHRDGRREERTAAIRVDTTAAAIVVVAAPAIARPGEVLRLGLKPALPLSRLPALAGRPGGPATALKGAIEVKDVLVRAPWGEVVRAELEGRLGVWAAALHVPRSFPDGEVALEVVASDAAGNVSRRGVSVSVRAGPPARGAPAAYASVGGAAAFATVLVLSVVAGALLRRRRRAPPLRRVLLAGSVQRSRDP